MGSGLYGMLMFVPVAVFVAGLMVGRTPEYLGKKIEAFEVKMASLATLIPLAPSWSARPLPLSSSRGTMQFLIPDPTVFPRFSTPFFSVAQQQTGMLSPD